jgi:hypothetical protein
LLGHVVETFRRYIATAGDILQERPYLLRPFRPTEGQQQDGVKIH